MNTLKLLPRWCRFLGLALIVPTIVIFFINPEVAFGDMPSFLSDGNDPARVKMISLVNNESMEDSGDSRWFTIVETEIVNEILLTLMLLGTWLIAFAKIKGEDEFSGQLRLQSMVSAIVWNSIILLVFNFVIFDGLFLYVMISQLFSFLLIFSLIFALKVRKFRKDLGHEE